MHAPGERAEPGGLEQRAVHDVTSLLQGQAGRANAVHRRERHHDPRWLPDSDRLDDGGAAASDIGRVRVGEPAERLGCLTLGDPDVYAMPAGVLPDQPQPARITFDRDDRRAEAGALDADGAGTGADIPDQPAWCRRQPGQRERAYLRLGDNGVLLAEVALGERPAAASRAARRPVPADGGRGRGRLAGEDDDNVRVVPVPAGCLGRGARSDALGWGAEMLGDDQPTLPARQCGTELRRAEAGAGEHRHLGMGAAHVDGEPRVTAVNADHLRVVPGQPGAGEGERDGGDRRPDGVLKSPLAQDAEDAEEPGVTRGEDDGTAVMTGQRLNRRVKRPELDDSRPGRRRRGGEVPAAPHDQGGGGERGAVGRGERGAV